MTSTISAIITESLQLLGIVADGRQPTATQSLKALTVLNDRLTDEQADGWHLGWYPQTNPATALTANAPLRDADIGPVKLLLAGWLAPYFGVTIPPMEGPDDKHSLAGQIQDAYRKLTKRGLSYTEADFGELSRAQGGPWGGGYWF